MRSGGRDGAAPPAPLRGDGGERRWIAGSL